MIKINPTDAATVVEYLHRRIESLRDGLESMTALPEEHQYYRGAINELRMMERELVKEPDLVENEW